jgi:hypothetical protein
MKEKKTKTSKEEILRLNQELSILNTLSQTVNQSIDLDEILNVSLDKMMRNLSTLLIGGFQRLLRRG